jgi:hypothetical protein
LFCNRAHEEGCHLFVKCKEVKLLWRSLAYENLRHNLETSNTEAAMDVVWSLPETQKIQTITMWWLRWQERSRIRGGEIPTQIHNLAHQVKCTAAEF